jgi:peptidoglycan L-alanyl-D-glutamate endopeptidase CwlK
MPQIVQKVNRNYEDLAPFFAQKLKAALAECSDLGYSVDLFEGYRSPERQDWLYAQGRSREGKIVTHAKAWQSWHQYGLAADIVGKVNGKWDWSIDYDKIGEVMARHGFETLKFEKAHFQITQGMQIKKAANIAQERGLIAVWFIIQSGIQA